MMSDRRSALLSHHFDPDLKFMESSTNMRKGDCTLAIYFIDGPSAVLRMLLQTPIQS